MELLLANLTLGKEPPLQLSSTCIKCCGGLGWRPRAPYKKTQTINHHLFNLLIKILMYR